MNWKTTTVVTALDVRNVSIKCLASVKTKVARSVEIHFLVTPGHLIMLGELSFCVLQQKCLYQERRSNETHILVELC